MQEVIEKQVKRNVNGQRKKVGVIVATKNKSGGLSIGYSLTKTSVGDVFDVEHGRKLAIERTKARHLVIPRSLKEEVNKMVDRGHRYFKTGYLGMESMISFNNS